MTDTSPDLLEALRSGAVRVVPVEATQDMAAAGEVALVGVLRGVNYFMPDDGMRRVLNAAFSASPDHTPDLVALIEGLSDRAESCDQWRKLALQFDRHRIEAMSLIKSVAAGTVGAAECAAFAAAPPPLTSPAEAERDALRERVERAVAEEREACEAAIVSVVQAPGNTERSEDYMLGFAAGANHTADRNAAAIRTRQALSTLGGNADDR